MPSGSATGSTVTDANGHYIFSCLPAGTYNITFGSPGGSFSPSPSNVGSNDVTVIDGATNTTTTVTVGTW
ncbi:MAG: hypothetical protein HGA42_16055, partial [Nostocales cyanobacterium W4_Combined_metabat2_030]|nr:hypothetical protein [Nostocales cyanobacterium W4_Combined_metabat2_030]